MPHTYTSSPFNSTPFSSCCGIASQDRSGRPDTKCHKCGKPLHWHDDGLAERRREVGPNNCLMCGKPRSQCYC